MVYKVKIEQSLIFTGWELWQLVHPDNNFGFDKSTPAILDITLNISNTVEHKIKIEVSGMELMNKLHYAGSQPTWNPRLNGLVSTFSQFSSFVITLIRPYFNDLIEGKIAEKINAVSIEQTDSLGKSLSPLKINFLDSSFTNRVNILFGIDTEMREYAKLDQK